MPLRRSEDHATYWREPSLGGIELMRARFKTHSFARHAHDEIVIAVFEQGAERFEAGRTSHVAAAGSVLVIAPGVFHNGSAASGEPWRYRAFYPRSDLLLGLRRDLSGSGQGHALAAPVQQFEDEAVHCALTQAHRQLEERSPLLERQSAVIGAFACLLCHIERGNISSPRPERAAVRRARDCLESYYSEDVGIDALAEITGVSAAHLMHCFRREMGVPIHAYLTQVRLRHARDMLARGAPAAEVAAAVGFVDQSHLIRRFKKAYGVTPGMYVREIR
jgi:AraC-like DNA-binding protein